MLSRMFFGHGSTRSSHTNGQSIRCPQVVADMQVIVAPIKMAETKIINAAGMFLTPNATPMISGFPIRRGTQVGVSSSC